MAGYDYCFGILAGYTTGGQINVMEVYENGSKNPATDKGDKYSCFCPRYEGI